MASTNRSHEELLQKILDRAASDSKFRQSLLTDPGDAIWSGFGIRIPDGYRVRFIEKDADVDALIVLPDRPEAGGGDELSDDDLDGVAGGFRASLEWSD